MKYARLVGVVVGAHAAIILGIAGVLLFPGCATVSEGPGEGKGVLYPPPNEPRQVDVPPVGPQVTTPVPQEPWKERYTLYTVSKGDTLSGIAHRYGVSTRDIMSLSKIADPSKIRIDQVIKLPGKIDLGAVPAPVVQPQTPRTPVVKITVPAGGTTYVVKKGDSLSRIAQRHGVKTKTLAAANNLKNLNAIRIGQKLVIPGSATPPVVTPPVPPVTTPVEPTGVVPPVDGTSAVLLPPPVGMAPTGAGDTAEDGAEIVTTPDGKFRIVKAQADQDLYDIAIHWKAAVSELRRINNLTGSQLQPGQKIKVPINE